MTREDIVRNIINDDGYYYTKHSVLEIVNVIFDEHEAQLRDKDDEIELLKHRIEEAMKPKTCLGCLHCNKAYQLTSRPPQYKLNCGVFKTVFVNDFKQYCSRYEPKANQ